MLATLVWLAFKVSLLLEVVFSNVIKVQVYKLAECLIAFLVSLSQCTVVGRQS